MTGLDLHPDGGKEPEEFSLDLAFEEEPAVFDDTGGEEVQPEEDGTPGPLLAAATAWADIVLVLVVCAMAVAGTRLLGLPLSGAVFPWACGLGALSWVAVSAILLPIRRSWPGALVLGLVLSPESGGGRVLRRLLLVLLAAATGGLVSAALTRFDPWAGLVPEEPS